MLNYNANKEIIIKREVIFLNIKIFVLNNQKSFVG